MSDTPIEPGDDGLPQPHPDDPNLPQPHPDIADGGGLDPNLPQPHPDIAGYGDLDPNLPQPHPDDPNLPQPHPDDPNLPQPHPDQPTLPQPHPDIASGWLLSSFMSPATALLVASGLVVAVVLWFTVFKGSDVMGAAPTVDTTTTTTNALTTAETAESTSTTGAAENTTTTGAAGATTPNGSAGDATSSSPASTTTEAPTTTTTVATTTTTPPPGDTENPDIVGLGLDPLTFVLHTDEAAGACDTSTEVQVGATDNIGVVSVTGTYSGLPGSPLGFAHQGGNLWTARFGPFTGLPSDFNQQITIAITARDATGNSDAVDLLLTVIAGSCIR